MIVLLAAGFVGGATGAVLAWGHGLPALVMAAPAGASLSTLAAAVISGYRPADWLKREKTTTADAGQSRRLGRWL